MSGTKFLRNVRVTIAQMKPEVFFANPNNRNAIVIDSTPANPVRIKFKIEKTLDPSPNNAEIEIYNLAESTRNEAVKKPAFIRVEAGYAGNYETLMAGDLVIGSNEHVGNDWITKVQFMEGERAYVNARISKSFAGGVDARTAVAEVAKSMGLKIPTSIAEAKELKKQFVSGVTLHGPSREVMAKVLPKGLGWSIQNNALQILRDGESNGTTAILISPATGMIESPIIEAPKEPGKPVTVKVKTLLEAGIHPGGRVQIVADGSGGLWNVDKVTFTGDTRGKEFFSEVEGVAA